MQWESFHFPPWVSFLFFLHLFFFFLGGGGGGVERSFSVYLFLLQCYQIFFRDFNTPESIRFYIAYLGCCHRVHSHISILLLIFK